VSLIRSVIVTAIGVAAMCFPWTNNATEMQEIPEQAAADRPPPVLVVERRNSQVTITGDVSSTENEARILQIAESFIPNTELKTELRLRAPLPAGWGLVTELVLRAIKETHSSTAYVDEQQIFIRGFTLDQFAWQATTAQLKKNLLPDMRFEHEVERLKIGASLEEQCRQLFTSVAGERHMGFKPSSNELSTNAFSLLDGIIQIAADCPSASITITGHTDNSGDEQTNQPLSKARADSVVAYMVASGIAAERLQSNGAGSSVPLSTDDNARARKLNRRIEFEISFPQ